MLSSRISRRQGLEEMIRIHTLGRELRGINTKEERLS